MLFEGTYGECESADQPFIIGSMSRSFTALAIMQFAERGCIDLDSQIDAYIDPSEWFVTGTDYSRITVRDLLNQTSGITGYAAFGSLESTDSYGSHIYANANYGLLGLIIEAVSGMTYEEYVTRNIFEPLEMKHSAASLEKSRGNSLLGNIVMPLLGGERQDTPNMYLILHAAIDAAYIVKYDKIICGRR